MLLAYVGMLLHLIVITIERLKMFTLSARYEKYYTESLTTFLDWVIGLGALFCLPKYL